jgi:enoyl-CoA hydratase/carnithine racemase
MGYENLIYEKHGHVGIVTMNRPEHLNAMSSGMEADLKAVFVEMDLDADVRVTILTANGRGFCSGAYLKDENKHVVNGPEVVMKPRLQGRSTLETMWDYPKPLLSAVNGLAYGGGLNYVLCSDLTIACEEATFCFPMPKIGIIPAVPGVGALVLRVGAVKAAEMSLLGEPITAREAYESGLINKVVPSADLMSEALAWAEKIADCAPMSERMIKEDLQRSIEHHWDASATWLRDMMCFMSEDRAEGHRAWRNGRTQPNFVGR